MPFVSIENVSKKYESGKIPVVAVENISFELVKGDFAMIVGPSGGGKTTILNLLGGMDHCDSGKIVVDGKKIHEMNKKQLTLFRRQQVGYVFQFYNLLQNLTALENIEIATKVATKPLYARDMLERVGLRHRKDHFPAQLSGGEQQRVAIARALAKKPKLLLCDEPTGALDWETGKEVLQVLQETAHLYDMTVVIITHNMEITPLADQLIHIKNGTVDKIVENNSPKMAIDLD